MSLNAQDSNHRCPASNNHLAPKSDNYELPESLDSLSSPAPNPSIPVDKSVVVLSIAKQEFREAQDQLLFIFPELKEPFQNSPLRGPLNRREVEGVTMTPPPNPSSFSDRPPVAPSSTPSSRVMSGVLWKRRDVFVRQWRPRWFMLYPEQGMLSYYLLTASFHPSPPPNPNAANAEPNSVVTSTISNGYDTTGADPSARIRPSTNNVMSAAAATASSSLPPLRSRTSSWDSVQQAASENTMDLRCRTARQSSSVSTESSSHPIHLAARTEALRAEWVAQIQAVCLSIHPPPSPVVGRGVPRRVVTEPAMPRTSRVAAATETIQPRRLLLAPPSGGAADQVTEFHAGTASSTETSGISASPVNSSKDDDPKTRSEGAVVANGSTKPPVELQFIILMLPIVLHWVLYRFDVAAASLVFCASALFSVRQVVCWYIGQPLIQNDDHSVIGPVTCRFRVDLKGIVRFISNKKEERVEMKSVHADVSVVHIVASALALALKKEPILQTRKVSIPWLFINRVIDASKEPVDVSVSENGGGIVTLSNVDQRSIEEIADLHAAADKNTDKTNKVGNCLILSMSNYDERDMITDAVPFHQAVAVVAVLGGVHLERKENVQVGSSGAKDPPKPVLSLSLTITGSHQSADIVICRRFADEVRKLLVYPEICENLDGRVPMKK